MLLLALIGIIAALFSVDLPCRDQTTLSLLRRDAGRFLAEQLGTDQILLRWSAVSGATGYSVYALVTPEMR